MIATEREQRYHVTADIDVRAPPGIEFRLEDIDLVKKGSFHDAEGDFALALGSTLGELRKLALVSDALHDLVRRHDEAPDGTPAILRLVATRPLLARMAQAVPRAGEPDAEALVNNEAWLRAALSFDEYEPEALELIERPAWRD